eukprot:scaffold380357_cov70-Cyclotella_meneghiniana.AAC.2
MARAKPSANRRGNDPLVGRARDRSNEGRLEESRERLRPAAPRRKRRMRTSHCCDEVVWISRFLGRYPWRLLATRSRL